jgi:hypothetical protein
VSTDLPPPYRGAYWVIPGELLAGPYPVRGHGDERDEALVALLDAGIRSIIDLMEEEEVDNHEEGELYPRYEDRIEALAGERNTIVEIQRHPIVAAAPPPLQELELIVDAVDNEVAGRNSPTLVHCSDGNGRTGLIVGCYLARHGIANGQDVIEKIRELRAVDPELVEQKSPDNIVQERIVTRWKEGQ